MLPEVYQITTKMLYQGALLFALLDAVIIPVLVWRIQPDHFRQVKWTFVAVAGIFWFGIWYWAIANFWETVYRYVFPDWARSMIPFLFGLLMAGIGLIIWVFAQRFMFHPVIGYSILGGLWGVCTHIWAVYRGVVEKPPMLQGASPVAAVVIAFFEYIFLLVPHLECSRIDTEGMEIPSREDFLITTKRSHRATIEFYRVYGSKKGLPNFTKHGRPDEIFPGTMLKLYFCDRLISHRQKPTRPGFCSQKDAR